MTKTVYFGIARLKKYRKSLWTLWWESALFA